MDITKLPKSVLERVFNYLKCNDLLNLSLVCKHFNTIISNSSIALGSFEVLITDFENREWIGMRKYLKVYIEDCREDNLLEHEKVFEDISDSVIEMEIRNLYQVELNNLLIFLNKFENLTKLTLFSLELYNESSSQEISSSSFKSLNYLEFSECDVQILNFFKNCQLKIFKVMHDFGEKSVLVDFLILQRNLESLEISYFDHSSELFRDETILSSCFKLKTFILNEDRILNGQLEIFKKFLKKQQDSLEYFGLYEENYQILNFVNKFSKLKTLRIFGGSDTINIRLNQMSNIKILYLESKIQNFPSIFPNLETLKTNTHFVDFSNIGKLRNLRHLEINNFWDIPIFNNKNIKSLKLVGCSFENIGKFNFDNNRLEMLTIKGCYFIHWLQDFLLHKDQNLKYLEISEMDKRQEQLTQEMIIAVNKIKHKIHTVIAPHCI